MKKITLLITAILAWLNTYPQRVEWVDYAYCTTQWNEGSGIVTDNAGNVYVLGDISAQLIIQNDTFINQWGTNDILLLKYSPQGNLIWGKVFGSAISDAAYNLSIDGMGHLYAECTIQGTTMMSDTTYSPPFDHQLIQFDTASNFQRYYSHLREIIADAQDGYVYMAYANIVEKRDTAFNLIWSQTASNANMYFSNIGPQGGRASMMVGNNGHLVLAGYENAIGGSSVFDTLMVTFSASVYCDEIFVLSMDTSGSALWAHTLDSSSTYQELTPKVAVNDAGDVYLGLYSEGDTMFFASDTLFNTTGISYTAWLKYNAAGMPQWAIGCIANGSMTYPYDIAINAQQDVLLCGKSYGPGMLGNYTLPATTLEHAVPYIAKINPAGTVQWHKTSDVLISSTIKFNSIANRPNGDYAVTGSYPSGVGPVGVPFSIGCYPAIYGSRSIMTFTLSENMELYPVAAFSITPQTPYTFSFTDLSANAVSWHWDFGDSDTSNLQNPVHTYATAGTFTVTLTVKRGPCTDTDTAQIVNVGIEEVSQGNFISIFPNPAGSVLQINSLKTIDEIKVFDMSGKKLLNHSPISDIKEFNLPTSDFANGIYFVEVISKDMKSRAKFVCEK